MKIGESNSVDDARVLMDIIRPELDGADCDVPLVKMQIDWGPRSKGQGRRSGHMVHGSMSAAPGGVKTYLGVDTSKYKADWGGKLHELITDGHELCRYFKAREFGCNEIEARYYAIT